MRTANPALNNKTFSNFGESTDSRMTLMGTVHKTGLLLLILLLTASFTWSKTSEGDLGGAAPWVLVGVIGGLVAAFLTFFKKEWAPISGPIYAAFQGLFLGGLSAMFEIMYPGIVVQAVALTFGTLGMLLVAYRTGLIKATENFRLGVAAATGGIFMVYLVSMILSFFGTGIPYIHEGGMIGIGFSLFVVVIAALNLVLDFDFIENGAKAGAPKYMEWYGAFGLMVTLIWLYIEILHLLAKMRR